MNKKKRMSNENSDLILAVFILVFQAICGPDLDSAVVNIRLKFNV